MRPRRALYTLILLVIALLGLIVGALNRSAPSADAPTQIMTLDPTVRANIRDLPNAAPLTGELAQAVNTIAGAVSLCPDYDPRRRAQMEQHIAWLLRPADIPRELIPAFGANPQERLLFGMATFTQIDWRQRGSRRDSCLFAIGRLVNALLIRVGGEPVAAFAS
jgi:hypothetical protein